LNKPERRKQPVPGGERIFHRIYTRLGCAGRPPHFVVEYHPYTVLSHTIRLKEDTAHVRLSDVLRKAPLSVVEAAAAILLGRLYRRQPPRELLDAYREFSYAGATRRRVLKFRKKRARRAEHRPSGTHHNLEQLFAVLNERYFGAALATPLLAWSSRNWSAQLGCYDPALNQIVLNRRLDNEAIPEYVVAYVLYHEMLHQKHPMKFARCRRESHGPKFRREEKIFAEYEQAMKFLEQFPAVC
jgi:predicted metal-dependent hydrolase